MLFARKNKKEEDVPKVTGLKDLMVLILTELQQIFYPLNVVWWKAILYFAGGILCGFGFWYLVGALIKVYLMPPPAPTAPTGSTPITTTAITFAPPPW